MKPIGIDTNALITFRLKREPEFKQVKNLIEKCLLGKIKVYIPLPVLLEIEWVLRSFYNEPKEKIIKFFEELLLIDNVLLTNKDEVNFTVNLYKNTSGVSFTDCFIVRQVQSQGFGFLTFDKQLENLYNSLL